jgi:DNA topoisomerase-1
MDYNFTANVESDFDEIAKGNAIWNNVIKDFYVPFHEKVKEAGKSEGKIGVRELGNHPDTNKPIYARIGRFGPMIQMGDKDDEDKPKFAKIGKEIDFNEITLEQAIDLLKWPRELGDYKGKPVTVAIGKFGPYVKYDGSFTSITEEYDAETINFDEAVELLKESLKAKSNRVIKEFKSKNIIVLNGKYGPYIKKGKKNYKIPEYQEASELKLKDCEDIIKNASKRKKKK